MNNPLFISIGLNIWLLVVVIGLLIINRIWKYKYFELAEIIEKELD